MENERIPRPEERAEQPLFENACTPGYEDYVQCYRKLMLFSPASWIGVVVLAAYAELVRVFLGGFSSPLIPGLIAAVAALYLYKIFSAPQKQARLTVRRFEETLGRLPEVRISFYGDRLNIHNCASNGDTGIRYEDCVLCTETKDFLLLRTRQKHFVPLAKAGFAGTDAEGCKRFLEAKAKNAKRRWS